MKIEIKQVLPNLLLIVVLYFSFVVSVLNGITFKNLYRMKLFGLLSLRYQVVFG